VTKRPEGMTDLKLYISKDVKERFRRQCKRLGYKMNPLITALVEEFTTMNEQLEKDGETGE
jgi:hypothetical protein